MSALPPIADIRVSMSAFAPIASASPPGADLPGGAAARLVLTQGGNADPDSATWRLQPDRTFPPAVSGLT